MIPFQYKAIGAGIVLAVVAYCVYDYKQKIAEVAVLERQVEQERKNHALTQEALQNQLQQARDDAERIQGNLQELEQKHRVAQGRVRQLEKKFADSDLEKIMRRKPEWAASLFNNGTQQVFDRVEGLTHEFSD